MEINKSNWFKVRWTVYGSLRILISTYHKMFDLREYILETQVPGNLCGVSGRAA